MGAMMTQAGLWDRPVVDRVAAAQAAEAGIEKAARKLTPAQVWGEQALAAVERVARQMTQLSSDDVWRELGAVDDQYASQMGVIMRRAARMGWIEATGRFEESARPSRHRSAVRIWVSRIAEIRR